MPVVLAHRGVSSEFPENTIEAFGAARFRGADGVELDVRVTADGDLAVHHNPRLDDGRVIGQLTRGELPDEVPTLQAALEACEGLTVNIELKNLPGEPDFDPSSAIADRTVATVNRLGLGANVIISSFNLSSLERVHQLDPQLATGWLVIDVAELGAMLDRLVDGGHRAIHPPVGRTSAQLIRAAHDRGLQVNTWTVDDPIRIEQLAGDGVDAVITNVPDVAHDVLVRWSANAND
jgi:glycerophosphoryl diester phosphodiesterase